MKQKVIQILRCIAVWAASLALLTGLMFLTALIPDENIKDNLIESGLTLMKAEPHEPVTENMYHSIQDNYADAVLLGVISGVSSENPVYTAINTMYYDGGDKGESHGIVASAAGVKPNTDYTRYWHGSMIVLRPLLTFADIDSIKIISAFVMLFLASLSCYMLIKRKNTDIAVIFVLSLAMVQAFYVPISLEYIIVFTIMLALCPFYIQFSGNNTALLLLSVLGGTVTAFTDFLTTETMTLLVLLLLVLFIRIKDGSFSAKSDAGFASGCGAGWFLSYIFTFVSKWVLATIVTGENKFTAALESFAERTSGNAEEFENPVQQSFSALAANLTMLFPGPDRINPVAMLLGFGISALLAVFIIFKFRGNPSKGMIVILAVTAVLPALRFMVLGNHSYLHCFFTYRALMSSIMSVLGIIWFSLDRRKLPFSRQPEIKSVKKRKV